MKKVFCIILCLIMFFIFTACGNNNSEIICYNCNKKISTEDTYCKYCGTKVVNNVSEKTKVTASILISNFDTEETSISEEDINGSKSVAITCVEIFKSTNTMQKVQGKLDFYISISDLEDSIQFNFQTEDSNILNITVFSEKKENADKILSCLLNEYPSIVKNSFPNANFSIISIGK